MGISRVEGMLGQSFPGGKVDRGGHEKRMNQRFAKVKVFSLVFWWALELSSESRDDT